MVMSAQWKYKVKTVPLYALHNTGRYIAYQILVGGWISIPIFSFVLITTTM